MVLHTELITLSAHLRQMEHTAAYAMLVCHANTDKLKEKAPRIFLKKAIAAGHESILEHIVLTYEIQDLSRACLQELARHRHISLSVESTRFTLKEKLQDGKYKEFLFTPVQEKMLDIVANLLKKNPDLANDELKYLLPEFWPTRLVLTANVRELRHIVRLRSRPEALEEFQNLAIDFVDTLPSDFRYLLVDCICPNTKAMRI